MPIEPLKVLLLRAHFYLCDSRAADNPDPSDLIRDIRSALDLPVTDCEDCRRCIANVEAMDLDGCQVCPACYDELKDIS